MVTKSSEENKFGRQIATFSEEVKNSSPILKNIYKWRGNHVFINKDITNCDENSLKTRAKEIFRSDVYSNEIFCRTKWYLVRWKYSLQNINNRLLNTNFVAQYKKVTIIGDRMLFLFSYKSQKGKVSAICLSIYGKYSILKYL